MIRLLSGCFYQITKPGTIDLKPAWFPSEQGIHQSQFCRRHPDTDVTAEGFFSPLTASKPVNNLDMGFEVPPPDIYFSEFKATVYPNLSMVFDNGMITMKVLFSIIAGSLIILTGLSPAFGFVLPRTNPDKGSPYGFGYHYDYDNAGSSWDHERVYRHFGYRNHYNRWYYHYGHIPQHYNKHRYYLSPGDRHKAHIYSRHKYAPKNYSHQKHIQLRDRIPRHTFQQTRPFQRVRIGR